MSERVEARAGAGWLRAAAAALAAWSVAAGAFAQTTFTQVAVIHTPAHLVEVDGRRAYVVHEKTLTLYDIATPGTPVKLGAVELPEKIWGIRIVGPLVYAAADFYGLAIIDAGDPKQPVLRGRIKTPGQAKNVAVIDTAGGRTALVADHMSGVDIIDVSNAAQPVVRDSYFLEGYARDVTSVGSVAIAVDSPAGVYAFDLSRSGPVEPVGSQQSARAPASVEVSKGPGGQPDLAVLVGGGSLQIYDVNKPASPVKAAVFPTPSGRPVRATLAGRRAYVADGREGLQVVDLTTPGSPAIVGSFKTTSPARDVAVADGHVLVATGNDEEGEILILAVRP